VSELEHWTPRYRYKLLNLLKDEEAFTGIIDGKKTSRFYLAKQFGKRTSIFYHAKQFLIFIFLYF